MKTADNLEAWRAFIFTGTTGSITSSSIQLNSEISTISRYIRGLEEEFGVLFDRRSRPWKLTKRGAELFTRVQPLIDRFDALQQLSPKRRKKTRIRISAPGSLGRDFIASMLLEYSQSNKNVEFELQLPTNIEGLLNGKTDIAFLIEPPRHNQLIFRKNISASTWVFTSKTYLKTHKEPLTPEDLSEHVGIMQTVPNVPDTTFLVRGKEISCSLNWKSTMFFNDQGNIKRMLLKGEGISPDLTPTICLDEIRRGEIVPLLKGWRRDRWDFCVVTNKRKKCTTPELTKFADWYSQRQWESAAKRMQIAEDLIEAYWDQKQTSY